MFEITQEESKKIREINNNIVISQTMKNKKRRGKYFIEESVHALKLLNFIRNNQKILK